MAAGILPAPGTEHGPCGLPCLHTDCDTTREMAAVTCPYCGDLIGYGRRFYAKGHDKVHDLVHAFCLERDVDRVRQEQAEARDRRSEAEDTTP